MMTDVVETVPVVKVVFQVRRSLVPSSRTACMARLCPKASLTGRGHSLRDNGCACLLPRRFRLRPRTVGSS